MKCNCIACALESIIRDQLDIPAPVVRTGQGSYTRDYPLQSEVSTQKDTDFTITCSLQGDGNRVLKMNDVPVISTDNPSEMTRYKTLVEVSLTLYKAYLKKHNLLK